MILAVPARYNFNPKMVAKSKKIDFVYDAAMMFAKVENVSFAKESIGDFNNRRSLESSQSGRSGKLDKRKRSVFG